MMDHLQWYWIRRKSSDKSRAVKIERFGCPEKGGKRLHAAGELRSQADSVANLPDGSDKFSQRNPKIDFRDFVNWLLDKRF